MGYNFKDSDDETETNVDIDKKIEQIFNSKKNVREKAIGADAQGERK